MPEIPYPNYNRKMSQGNRSCRSVGLLLSIAHPEFPLSTKSPPPVTRGVIYHGNYFGQLLQWMFEPPALASHLTGGSRGVRQGSLRGGGRGFRLPCLGSARVRCSVSGLSPWIVVVSFVLRVVICCCGWAVRVCQVQRSRILVLFACPALRLRCACSGPVHAMWLSVCPRSQRSWARCWENL